MQGRVKNWYPSQHFGFIRIDGGMSFFFHGSQVKNTEGGIRTGQEVEFLLADDPKYGNLVAVDVQVVPKT